MKKKLFIFIVTALLLIPTCVNAGTKKILNDDYETKNFVEALDDEGIEKHFSNYQESNDKITIYLFRGKGCTFCKAYLTFMDSITEEYGKYFNMVSFEVWNNENNWNLMQRVSYHLKNEVAGGVPYIIIGDKVFQGFAESYSEDIKKTIVDLYNTNKNDRYDVFKNIEKNGLISLEELKEIYQKSDTKATTSENYNTNSSKDSNTQVILWNLLFVSIGTTAIILFNNYKFNQIKEEMQNKEVTEERIKKKRSVK